mmetsp:Transcript_10147/g.26329  ORF Transcript_10147/g.26329 Transcript_10147/m.26329 type:complete len:274 (+) Transcript_10147:401-1222(+)
MRKPPCGKQYDSAVTCSEALSVWRMKMARRVLHLAMPVGDWLLRGSAASGNSTDGLATPGACSVLARQCRSPISSYDAPLARRLHSCLWKAFQSRFWQSDRAQYDTCLQPAHRSTGATPALRWHQKQTTVAGLTVSMAAVGFVGSWPAGTHCGVVKPRWMGTMVLSGRQKARVVLHEGALRAYSKKSSRWYKSSSGQSKAARARKGTGISRETPSPGGVCFATKSLSGCTAVERHRRARCEGSWVTQNQCDRMRALLRKSRGRAPVELFAVTL